LADLQHHWDYLEDAWGAAKAAPLSIRRIFLVAALADRFVDHLFEAAGRQGDVLEFRARLASGIPALRTIMALCGHDANGPLLAVRPVFVPTEHYGALAVEDFMVSLYNDHTVQRVVIIEANGTQLDAHETLARAMEALAALAKADRKTQAPAD
jgi:hypothetical protein